MKIVSTRYLPALTLAALGLALGACEQQPASPTPVVVNTPANPAPATPAPEPASSTDVKERSQTTVTQEGDRHDGTAERTTTTHSSTDTKQQ